MKKHFKTMNKEAFEQALLKMVGKQFEIILWKKGANDYIEKFKISSCDKDQQKLRIEYITGLLAEDFQSLFIGQEVLFEIDNLKTSYFGNGILKKNNDDQSLEINLKGQVFQTCYRQRFRLPAVNNIRLKFKMNSIVYEVLNVSSSGALIKIPPESDKGQIHLKEVLNDCQLSINNQVFYISSIMIVRKDIVRDANGKIDFITMGISFITLEEQVEAALTRRIDQELRSSSLIREMFVFNKAS